MGMMKSAFTLVILAACPILGMLGMQFGEKHQLANQLLQSAKENQQLREENKELSARAQKLAMANRLLKVDYQLARLRLVKQVPDPDPKKMISMVEFWEVDDQGNPLTEPRPYRLHGNQVHVEGLVAKFEDDLIEQGDPLRGAAMFAFKSIHGNGDAPEDGYPLPKKRAQPNAYERGGLPSSFEENLWRNFWELSHDQKAMEQLGLRAAHGQGVFQQLQEGVEYEVRLRSTGECTIKPLAKAEGSLTNNQRTVHQHAVKPWPIE